MSGGVVQSTAYCAVCQRQTLHMKPRINHVLHLILFLVTFGLWAFVWIGLGIRSAGAQARCSSCGTHRPPSAARQALTWRSYPVWVRAVAAAAVFMMLLVVL